MPSYDQKLAAFTEGKNLIRLPRPIRDRADASCDACGSNHPRTLYALKDSESDRHYFVGNTCLKELVKLGVILRRFGKESGASVFEKEMELRAASTVEQDIGASTKLNEPAVSRSDLDSSDASAAEAFGESALIPSVLILESPEHYQAVVSFNSTHGVTYGWGSALEPRFKKHWRQGGENGLVLEEVAEENPFASRLCLTSAWHEALSDIDGSSGVSTPWQNGRHPLDTNLGRPLLTLLRLDSTYAASANFSPSFKIASHIYNRWPNLG